MKTSENILMSGGADGSDEAWGEMAKYFGHHVIHWSFTGHNSNVDPETLVVLDDETLQEADERLKIANKSLQRAFPTTKPYINNLLRRNWFQVRDTGSLYAVGIWDKSTKTKMVKGGTAWAIQMYLDLCNEKSIEPKCYFYEQNLELWYEWQDGWKMRCSQPVVPSGVWTGIGTRELNEAGLRAIETVLGGLPLTDERLEKIIPTLDEAVPDKLIYLPDSETKEFLVKGGLARIQKTYLDHEGKTRITCYETNYLHVSYDWASLRSMQENLRIQHKINHISVKTK